MSKFDDLNEEEFNTVRNNTRNKFDDLISGKNVPGINSRVTTYLNEFKEQIKEALRLGYSVSSIARLMSDPDKNVKINTATLNNFIKTQNLGSSTGKRRGRRKKQELAAQASQEGQPASEPSGNIQTPEVEEQPSGFPQQF